MPIVVVQAVTGLAAGAITFRFGYIRPLIWTGMALATLGFGLFISIDTSTPLANIIIIETVAALGVGMTFQAPLIAYQSVVDSADVAVATALFGFVRSLSTSISVVIGSVIFQNRMAMQQPYLSSVLGPELARNFSASAAVSNVLTVHTLPRYQRSVVKTAYAASLQDMWILYASVGGLGLLATFFVKKQALGQDSSLSADGNSVELVGAPG
jgi:hypothetical protein